MWRSSLCQPNNFLPLRKMHRNPTESVHDIQKFNNNKSKQHENQGRQHDIYIYIFYIQNENTMIKLNHLHSYLMCNQMSTSKKTIDILSV